MYFFFFLFIIQLLSKCRLIIITVNKLNISMYVIIKCYELILFSFLYFSFVCNMPQRKHFLNLVMTLKNWQIRCLKVSNLKKGRGTCWFFQILQFLIFPVNICFFLITLNKTFLISSCSFWPTYVDFHSLPFLLMIL